MPVATQDALTGYGFSPHQASLLGGNPTVLTCAGTSQGAAAILKSKNTELSPASSQTGAIPPANAPVMEPYFMCNQQTTTAVVYVPSGHTLNTTLNGSVNVAQTKSLILWQYKPKFWTYNLTA